MDFFADEEEDAAVLVLVPAFEAAYPDVVVGDDDEVEAGRDGVVGDLAVPFFAVAVGGVHVEVAGGFDHRKNVMRDA